MSDRGSTDGRESRPSRGAALARATAAIIAVVVSIWWLATILLEIDPSDIPAQAIKKLRSTEAKERVVGARILSSAGQGRLRVAIPPLMVALGDEETEVRIASARAIGSLASVSVRARADTEDVRRACLALLRAADDDEPGVRTAVAAAWAEIFVAGRVIATREQIREQNERPVPTNLEVLRGLLKAQLTVPVDAEAVVAALGRMAGDRDAVTRQFALHALAVVAGCTTLAPPSPVMDSLRDGSPEIRAAAAAAVGHFRSGIDPAIPILLGYLDRDEPIVRKACATALDFARPSPAAVPLLVEALAHANREVRYRAARVVGRIGPEASAAIDPLILTLGETLDPREVAEKGNEMHHFEFAETMYSWGDNIRSWDAGCESAWALARIAPGSKSAKAVVAALRKTLHSEHRSRRVTAAVALCQFGPSASDTVDDLIEALGHVALDDPDVNDGVAFVRALGRVAPGSPESEKAIGPISRALRSGSDWTRETAVEALGRFGPLAAAVLPELRATAKDPDPKVRAAVASALSAIDPKATPKP